MSANLPKMPPNVLPTQKPCPNTALVVVTAEPKIKVPGRLTSAELRAMALRQQQQIDSQHQLLTTKEQRLRFLKSQDVQNTATNAEGERLRRLRERVEAQESKLRRLRALRGQVDLQKTYNVTLSNDLDSIRALFSEKEKELSLAVAKVEALTRQLEDLRRDRRCTISLLAGGAGPGQPLQTQVTRELEKLRRELMYRNQLSLQQDARLHLQREALQQRQSELRSVDQRIFELQTRLQRKRAANMQNVAQNQNHQLLLQQQLLHQRQQQQQHQQQQQQQMQMQQQQDAAYNADVVFQSQLVKQGVAALKQQLLEKHGNTTDTQPPPHGRPPSAKFANNLNRSDQTRLIRGNVAAVEPYIHTPQKSSVFMGGVTNMAPKHAAATANTNQQNKLIQDLTHVKLSLAAHNTPAHNEPTPNSTNPLNFLSGESDESKLAKKMLSAAAAAAVAAAAAANEHIAETTPAVAPELDSTTHIYAEVGPKKRDLLKDSLRNAEASSANASGSRIPKSIVSNVSGPALISKISSVGDKSPELDKSNETLTEKNTMQHTVHSVPLTSVNRSVATAVPNTATTTTTTTAPSGEKTTQRAPYMPGNLEVPPRKPISSVAPTSVTSSIPKIISYSPKVNRVAPSIVAAPTSTMPMVSTANAERPALPPKPHKASPVAADTPPELPAPQLPIAAPVKKQQQSPSGPVEKKPPLEMPTPVVVNSLQSMNINDNLPIKAKPLTIRKQPLSEQPRLKMMSNISKPAAVIARKSEGSTGNTPPYALTDTSKSETMLKDGSQSDTTNSSAENSPQLSPQTQCDVVDESNSVGMQVDEPDRSEAIRPCADVKKSPDNLKRRNRNGNGTSAIIGANGKPKLTRRVSFDPLALLLDASLEGELELVKKTAQQVTNPSAANDEGITALHNAICAGHFDIVKFLVEFGCDVNAQDSDGWTPLHCAASCNNLSMVKFLVENGACLFAATLSDHETPAEKCEEDEEGFDGCSEYLYSIQEKLGILHAGEVYAVFSYEAQNSDELTFTVNERLSILRKGDDAENEWWWAKNANDQEGYVPRNLLGLYPRVLLQHTHLRD